MNADIIKQISNDLNIKPNQVEVTLKMLEEGNTIPFISRYRKDVTGNLNEEQIKSISEVYMYQVNLLKRKEDVIRLIEEKDLMTDELKNKIMASTKLVEVEDLYRPFKEHKKTKATEAIKNGLEPLAKIIMDFPTLSNIETIVKPYLNDKVKTVEDAITGAKYIIAENISDNATYRKEIRRMTYYSGNMTSKKKKNATDELSTYEMYYEYSEPVKYVKPHRVLALNRGEKEDVLSVSIDAPKDTIISYLKDKIIKNKSSYVLSIVDPAIEDAYKRLIAPSIEREIRTDLTSSADEVAIDNFGKNLEALLLQPPLKEKTVLAFDPGFTNGCKLAVIDKTGKYLYSTVIKPFAASSNSLEISKKTLLDLINKYKVDIISIGNGTASRESEKLIAELIQTNKLDTKYVIVSEAGASIYSTEKVAQDEFPDLSPNERSAVSIGRRLQDPLSELVKIPPDGIGVGLYQHDVAQNRLKDSLDFVVSKAVNSVGVNVNTASPSLLKYVSGITKKNIDKIIDYRDSKGRFNSREEIKKAKLLSSKTYEQAIGFLRITEGNNILDETGIHPESYHIVASLLDNLGCTIEDVGTNKLIDLLDKVDINKYKDILKTDIYTLEDVINSLKKPNRDPRDSMPQPLLKSDILDIKDLKVGMKLQGTVRNVVDFGAFIDIGLHNDGLAHISKLTDRYIKHPSEVVKVGDIVDCYVIDKNDKTGKVSLSLIEPK